MRAVVLVLALAPLASCSQTPPSARPQPGVQEPADPADLEQALRTARIVSIVPLPQWLAQERDIAWDGSNPLMMVELDGELRAVFRHEDEPWGSVAEVAGYRMARQLEIDLVPETVLRTLRADELPADASWPFATATRQGSLQRFVEAEPSNQRGTPLVLDARQHSDIEILSFVMGRYDNHPGNLLVDAAADPWLVDFEGALDRQQTRLCEHPFIRRGGRARPPGVPVLDAGQPFPFDAPQRLVDPTLDELEATFAPWWGQFWPEGMAAAHERLQRLPAAERAIEYIVWDEQLWVRIPTPSRHAACVDAIASTTLHALQGLDRERLEREVLAGLQPPFDDQHVTDILERAARVVIAAEHLPRLP